MVRLKSDIAAAQKKHVDAEKSFEKVADVLKKAKMALDNEQIMFNAAKTTFDIADVAVKKTEDFKKESDEASSAQELAEDETWKTDVQDLKSSIEAVETLRVAVEKLNDEYVHPTAGPTPASTTSPTMATTTVPATTATTTVPITTAGPYAGSYVHSDKGTRVFPGDSAVQDKEECKAACAKTPGWRFVSPTWYSWYGLEEAMLPLGCSVAAGSSNKAIWNRNENGPSDKDWALICRAE